MKIDLCSGAARIPGWVNADIRNADVNIDLERAPLPFPDSCVQAMIRISAIKAFTRAPKDEPGACLG